MAATVTAYCRASPQFRFIKGLDARSQCLWEHLKGRGSRAGGGLRGGGVAGHNNCTCMCTTQTAQASTQRARTSRSAGEQGNEAPQALRPRVGALMNLNCGDARCCCMLLLLLPLLPITNDELRQGTSAQDSNISKHDHKNQSMLSR